MTKEILSLKEINHLYWRAGFGVPLNFLKEDNWNKKKEVDILFAGSKLYDPIAVVDLSDLIEKRKKLKMMSPEEQTMARKEFKKRQIDVSLNYFMRMVDNKQTLREKLSLFWMNHFACHATDAYYSQELLNAIRKNALGSFKILLNDVSKQPAMLGYLNAKQNRKEKPNENFARELMELFTIGRGNYTEQDIKEAARSLTGWTVKGIEGFFFNSNEHDTGSKTIFGKTGNFNGDDVLKLILDKKECAHFITKKIYREFVNEVVDEKIVAMLAEDFFLSGYDIEKLMHRIFSSDWFYLEKNIGSKIKSPLELLGGIMVTANITSLAIAPFLGFQKFMGQELFKPPNVAGWPGGKTWIDNSTIITRTSLAIMIFEKYRHRIKAKSVFDATVNEPKDLSIENNDKFSANWQTLTNYFGKYNNVELIKKLTHYLMQTNSEGIDTDIIKLPANETNKVRSVTIQLMTVPEYQLC